MAKFKAGDAVKLRDDVEYGEMYNKITLFEDIKKSTKYHIEEVANPNSRSGPDYRILELGGYVGEDALEAWPESTEETMSNEIDPQLFELVKAVTTGLVSNTNFTYIHNDEVVFSCKTAVDIAREIHRLLREEKL